MEIVKGNAGLLSVGVVGCGYWGSKHIRVLSGLPEVSDVVVIDGRADVRSAMGREFPGSILRSSLAEALDDIDAVVVATPPDSHFEIASAAMEAGKHCLVEKPMATSSSDAKRMVALAEANNVTLAAGHTFAYNAGVWKLADLVSSGELGDVHYLDAARLNLGLYRNDVNVLWDLAAHDISITTTVLKAFPDEVSAWGSRHTTSFSEDVATLRMRFDSLNVDSTVRVSWLDPLKIRSTTVVGSKKMAVFNDMDGDERIKIFDRGREQHAQEASSDTFNVAYRYGDIVSPYVAFSEPLKVELQDFLGCCRSGETPVADGLAGLAVTAVLEASDVSLANNGAPVPLDLPPSGLSLERQAVA